MTPMYTQHTGSSIATTKYWAMPTRCRATSQFNSMSRKAELLKATTTKLSLAQVSSLPDTSPAPALPLDGVRQVKMRGLGSFCAEDHGSRGQQTTPFPSEVARSTCLRGGGYNQPLPKTFAAAAFPLFS